MRAIAPDRHGRHCVLGLVTLGQTPRPDFEHEFRRNCPNAEIRIVGALDGFNDDSIYALDNPAGRYPLHARLRDGRIVNIPIADFEPLVQQRAAELADQGADLVVILCAGAISVSCPVPVLLPGSIMPAIVSGLTPNKTLAVLVPHHGQEEAAAEHWRAHGYHPVVASASPFRQEEMAAAAGVLKESGASLAVVDCMGHDARYRDEFAALVGKPTLLTQTVVSRLTGELVDAFARRTATVAVKTSTKELTRR